MRWRLVGVSLGNAAKKKSLFRLKWDELDFGHSDAGRLDKTRRVGQEEEEGVRRHPHQVLMLFCQLGENCGTERKHLFNLIKRP